MIHRLKAAAALLLTGSMLFVACKKDPVPPPPPVDTGNCNQSGKIEVVQCGLGIWGDYYIRTDAGKLIKPCGGIEPGFKMQPGQRIRFSTRNLKPGESCIPGNPAQITCVTYPQPDMAQVITCIKPIMDDNTGNCNTQGVIVNMGCAWGSWQGLWIKTNDGKLIKPCVVLDKSFSPKEGTPIIFGMRDLLPGETCPPSPLMCPETAKPDLIKAITCVRVANNSGGSDKCETLATVIENGGNCKYLIKLDNGSILEPYSIPASFQLRHGQRVKIGYDPSIKVASRCNGQPAIITCIEEVQDPNMGCKPTIIGPAPANRSPFTILNATLSGSCLKLKVGFSGCSDKYRKFDLFWSGEFEPTGALRALVKLRDLAEEEACQAYFTREYSFDVSAINKLGAPTPVLIRIEGYNQELNY